METTMASRKSPISDVNLIPRVKQYLEENVHKTYVDVEEMTQSLMTRYQEYSRRKTVPFRILVEHAYKTVLHSYGLDSNPTSDAEEQDGSDLELMDDTNNGNHMSNAITNLYMKKTSSAHQASEGDAAISIDISSDEDDSTDKSDNLASALNTGPNKVTVTRIPSANGSAKPTEPVATKDALNELKQRPGPASQKRRRMELIEETEKVVGAGEKQQQPQQQPEKQLSLAKIPVKPRQSSWALREVERPKPKKFKKEVYAKKAIVTFADVGGMDKALKELCELILHIKHPEMYRHIGLPPPRGFLLHGPPGSGKTLLAHAIAGQLDVLLVEVPATELIAGVSGESEERIREIFEQAAMFAPCVLFIDEIDAISSNRQTAQKDMERRIVAQLLSSLDNLAKLKFGDQVLVIGATNRPDALDPALRRVGRFDHEISLGIPDRQARAQILHIIARNLKIERPFDFDEMAALTPGYVGADLLALATRAASTAIKRVITDKETIELQNSLTISEKPEVIEPIVNIDEDSLLMEVDQGRSTPIAVTDVEEIKPEEQKEDSGKPAEDVAEIAPKETEVTNIEDQQIELTDQEEPIIEEPSEDTPMETLPEKPKTELSLSEAILKQTDVKLHLTLDNMIKWLQNDTQPMSDDELKNLAITREDFLDALKHVQPSAKREGFITVPDVTWDDIGSLQDIRSELKLAILAPVKFPEKLKKLGLQSPSGVLLCGPPGCGKTLLAKAVANEAGINFISVKGPELLNMYVGESERAVRQCFLRARNSAPCVIFFDEFDSLCPKRSDSGENGASQRVVNQLLTEMDGIEDRKGVFLMAATNRPDIVDPAVLRPGRLDKILYVGLPEMEDRVDILKALTKCGRKPELAEDVDLRDIAGLTIGYSGADLAGLVRQASLQTLKESIEGGSVDSDESDLKVHRNHFIDALNKLKPSVGEQDIKHYEKLKEKYGAKKDA